MTSTFKEVVVSSSKEIYTDFWIVLFDFCFMYGNKLHKKAQGECNACSLRLCMCCWVLCVCGERVVVFSRRATECVVAWCRVVLLISGRHAKVLTARRTGLTSPVDLSFGSFAWLMACWLSHNNTRSSDQNQTSNCSPTAHSQTYMYVYSI